MSSGGSNGLLRQGAVSQKAVFGSKQRKYLYLVFPRDIDHLKSLHGDILAGSDKKEKDNKSTELLGNLSFSAINEKPMLIISQSQGRTYIPFDTIIALHDETDLRSPCNFAITTTSNTYRFVCDNSFDYQDWIGAMDHAQHLTKNPLSDITPFAETYATSGTALDRHNTATTVATRASRAETLKKRRQSAKEAMQLRRNSDIYSSESNLTKFGRRITAPHKNHTSPNVTGEVPNVPPKEISNYLSPKTNLSLTSNTTLRHQSLDIPRQSHSPVSTPTSVTSTTSSSAAVSFKQKLSSRRSFNLHQENDDHNTPHNSSVEDMVGVEPIPN